MHLLTQSLIFWPVATAPPVRLAFQAGPLVPSTNTPFVPERASNATPVTTAPRGVWTDSCLNLAAPSAGHRLLLAATHSYRLRSR